MFSTKLSIRWPNTTEQVGGSSNDEDGGGVGREDAARPRKRITKTYKRKEKLTIHSALSFLPFSLTPLLTLRKFAEIQIISQSDPNSRLILARITHRIIRRGRRSFYWKLCCCSPEAKRHSLCEGGGKCVSLFAYSAHWRYEEPRRDLQ